MRSSEFVSRKVEILLTKDNDFVESFVLRGRPKKLLLLSCGNLSNPDLEQLLRNNILKLLEEFESNNFLELSRTELIVHS